MTNALALAALAALGAGGEDAHANTVALQSEPTSRNCLNESKLNLYQCLAASRPSYEDMFCIGRHIVRDLATCTRAAALPAATVTVSDLEPVDAPPPIIVTAPLDPPRQPPVSPTEQLNIGTGTPVPNGPSGD